MKKQLRIVLTHKDECLTRDQLSTSERNLGETFFRGIALEWGGWIIQEDTFKQSVQWFAPLEELAEITKIIGESNWLPNRILNITIVDDAEAEEQNWLTLAD